MFFFSLTDFWYNWNLIHGLIVLFLVLFFLALFLQISFFSLLVRSLQILGAVGLIFLLLLQLKNFILLPGFTTDLFKSNVYINNFFINNFGSNFKDIYHNFNTLVPNSYSTTLWFTIDYDPFFNFIITILVLFLTFLYIGLSDYMMLKENYRIEYPLMFFLILISGICLILSNDIISILISLECITFSGYILVGFDKTRRLSASAGIRYLILGSIPSAFLVIGLAFLYNNFGIFTKDALELMSASFIEVSSNFLNSFDNLENSLKYDLPKDTLLTVDLENRIEELKLKKISKNFLIDTTSFELNNIIKQVVINTNNNLDFSNLIWHRASIEPLNDYYQELNHAQMEAALYHDLFNPSPTVTTTLARYLHNITIDNPVKILDNHVAIDLNSHLLHFNFNEENEHELLKQYALEDDAIGLTQMDTDMILNTNLNKIAEFIHLDNISLIKALLLFQISSVLILINLLFKVTGAPFHIWAPSIYTNAPTMSVIFLSIFIKLIIFSFIILVFVPMFYTIKNVWGFILFITGILSILSGLMGAFNELMLKRFLIYSSVGHVGFISLGLPFIFIEGTQSTLNYLYVYSITSIILWLLVSSNAKEIKFLTNLKTILMRNYVLSIIFTFVIFSMSGIPPLAGFFVKFDILLNLMKSTNLFFVGFVLLLTVITFFYYLRMIKIIFFETIFWENHTQHLKWSDGRFFIICLLINFILLYSIIIEQSFAYYLYKLILFSL